MNWYITKVNGWLNHGNIQLLTTLGMLINEKVSVSIELSKTVSDTAVPSDFIITTDLYTCGLSDAPEFMWEEPSGIYDEPSTI
jgi:hypothetical protein